MSNAEFERAYFGLYQAARTFEAESDEVLGGVLDEQGQAALAGAHTDSKIVYHVEEEGAELPVPVAGVRLIIPYALASEAGTYALEARTDPAETTDIDNPADMPPSGFTAVIRAEGANGWLSDGESTIIEVQSIVSEEAVGGPAGYARFIDEGMGDDRSERLLDASQMNALRGVVEELDLDVGKTIRANRLEPGA